MNTLLEVLAARRVFLDTLGGLYRRHFARLARWLAPPSGLAAAIWTALPLAYVIVYNGSTPEPDKAAIPDSMYMLAWETAWRMQSLPLLASLQDTRRPQELICPLDWRIE